MDTSLCRQLDSPFVLVDCGCKLIAYVCCVCMMDPLRCVRGCAGPDQEGPAARHPQRSGDPEVRRPAQDTHGQGELCGTMQANCGVDACAACVDVAC